MSHNQAMTITDFIRARIDEDERLASDAQRGGIYPHIGDTAAEEVLNMAEQEGCSAVGIAHFRRHDPERVLWDCGVKRRMLGWIERGQGQFDDVLLLELARFWHDHPDFDSEWGNDE